jgi:hypothetical protein
MGLWLGPQKNEYKIGESFRLRDLKSGFHCNCNIMGSGSFTGLSQNGQNDISVSQNYVI